LIGLISLGILIAAFVFQFVAHKSRKNYKTPQFLFWGSALAVLLYYFYLVYAQYFAWKNDGGISKFLVPPYESFLYVFGYHFVRFLLYYLIAFFVAVLFFAAAKHYNRKFDEKFFETEEFYWGALSIFLLGGQDWGYAWIYYFLTLLVIAVIGSTVQTYVLKKNERFSFYWLWLPVAILVLLVAMFVS